ncbi:MAG: hypothetical protein ICV60_13110 [Pyrinomonadaceae bacterium]|nr:hypothetical protein [Pyrinomonadaceae bacterium]
MSDVNLGRRVVMKMGALASTAALLNLNQPRPRAETRRFVLTEMDKLKLAYALSHANFFGLQVAMKALVKAMRTILS